MVMECPLQIANKSRGHCDRRMLRPVGSATGRSNYAPRRGWKAEAAPRHSMNAREAVVDMKRARPVIRTSAIRLGPSPYKESGAGTPEGSGRRGVGFVELDVSASRARTAQCVIRIEFGRIDDDAGLRQPDDELIVVARLASVSGYDDPIDVAELVRPRRAANLAGPGRAALGVGARVDLQGRRDAGPVDVQSHPVVDVLEVPPGRRAVLASAPDTEVCLRAAVADDEPAAGQEVALPRIRGAAGEHQRDRRDP